MVQLVRSVHPTPVPVSKHRRAAAHYCRRGSRSACAFMRSIRQEWSRRHGCWMPIRHLLHAAQGTATTLLRVALTRHCTSV
jgi:hypothetical protein